MNPTVVSALAGLGVAWATTWALRRLAPRVGLVDWPNDRSLHADPRPRGGGAAIALGTAAAIAAYPGPSELGRQGAVLGGALLLLTLVGLWDDVRSLPAWPRLLVQLVAASAMVAVTGGLPRLPLPPPLDVPLGVLAGAAGVLWLLGVTNFFNFMDGIDGLATGQAALTLAMVAWLAWSAPAAALSLCALAACLGFLPHNWPPARIFLGDSGSAQLGFLLASLPLLAPPPQRAAATVAVATSLGLFLCDPTLVLLRRARARRRLGQAHREHAYQRLALARRAHLGVTIALLVAAAVLTCLAALGYTRPVVAWLGLAGVVLAFAIEELSASRAGTGVRAGAVSSTRNTQ
jgi:Fuc2NAc and GlcNAc transferase